MNGKKPNPLVSAIPRDLQRSLILPIMILFCQLSLTQAIASWSVTEAISQKTTAPASEAFRQAVNKATSAAQLTQSAKSRQDWNAIVTLWQDAVDLMHAVPRSSGNYKLAQKKASEYQNNQRYAQSKVLELTPTVTPSQDYWNIGASRDEIVSIQGTPTGVMRYDTGCREVLYYDSSTVEFNNGIAIDYDNLGNNLRVSVDAPPAERSQTQNSFWTLGSSREEVFRVQGTPTQISQLETSGREILYYGSSSVELQNGSVTEYNNLENNLRVFIEAPATQDADSSWGLGSNREEVFRVQGTPTQVVQYDTLCKEVLHYGSSTVELRRGIVDGYHNLGNILKVR
jgi:hypothetical protein